MSEAGVRSSAGDDYQDLVAAWWLSRMPADDTLLAVEPESTSLLGGARVRVDDVIVHMKNDRTVFCQSKEDQPKRGTWGVADLKDDLGKAWGQWQRDPQGEIHFYSAGPFGQLQALQQRAVRMPDVDAFLMEIPQIIDEELTRFLTKIVRDPQARAGAYSFFRRVRFCVKSTADLSSEALAYLRLYVTQAPTALALIKEEVRRVTCRRPEDDTSRAYAQSHTITRPRLLEILREAGLRITPPRSESELRTYVAQFSARGRIWQRDIAGHRFVRPLCEELVHHVEAGESILLEGAPGAGKTCLLLDILEHLEKNSQRLCIFLQTRDFEDADIADLELNFLNNLARMAEFQPVVVLVDSLDVLSTARRRGFHTILALMEQARCLPQVCVLAACRSFDLKYDPKLSALRWPQRAQLGDLDFDSEVVPLLQAKDIAPSVLSPEQQALVCNPRMLRMFLDIAGKGILSPAATTHDLANAYLDRMVVQNTSLGSAALAGLQTLATRMIRKKRLSLPRWHVEIADAILLCLLSEGVLLKTESDNYAFSHQTLVDVLAVEHAQSQYLTLVRFIQSMPAVPFIRPTVRTFFFSLRHHDSATFRNQVRAALVSPELAFHLKRLLAVSLAEIVPQPDDGPLLRHLFTQDVTLFVAFFAVVGPESWFEFFQEHFLPAWQEKDDWQWILRYTAWLGHRSSAPSALLVQLWTYLLADSSADKAQVSSSIVFAMDDFKDWDEPGLHELFSLLLQHVHVGEYDFLLKPLSRWVDAANDHDAILWNYMTRHVDASMQRAYDIKLTCAKHDFFEEDFLVKRMQASETLLSLAVSSLEQWSASMGSLWADGYTRNNFLHDTSHGRRRTQRDVDHFDDLNALLDAMERACIAHAEQYSAWWKGMAVRLWDSAESALRYMVLLGLIQNPHPNISLVGKILLHIHEGYAGYFFSHELACLLGAAAPYLADDMLEQIQWGILSLHEAELLAGSLSEEGVWRSRRDYLIELPAPYRIPESVVAIDKTEKLYGAPRRAPSITTRGGFVRSPVDCDTLLGLSESALFKLLQYYGESQAEDKWRDVEDNHIVGGTGEVAYVLADAASRDPEYFYSWAERHWQNIIQKFQEALLCGLAEHARYRFGNLSKDKWVPRTTPEETTLLFYLLQLLTNIDLSKFDAYSVGSALNACALLVRSLDDLERMHFLLLWCSQSTDPVMQEDSDDLLRIGLSSMRGEAAEAAFVIAGHWLEQGRGDIPSQLLPVLHQLAHDPHPAVRAMVLRRLPVLLHYKPDLGWQLFHAAVSAGPSTIWEHADQCLYYNYHKNFEAVCPYLELMAAQAMPEAGETWARIVTLAFLSEKIKGTCFRELLLKVGNDDAWKSAASVLSYNVRTQEVKKKCFVGLEIVLDHAPRHKEILGKFHYIFNNKHETFTFIPLVLVGKIFIYAKEAIGDDSFGFWHFPQWLLALSKENPTEALHAVELFLSHVNKRIMSADCEALVMLLTVLFREAEEREESDDGEMLQRVVHLQDAILFKGVSTIDAWFKEAERP